LVRVQVHKCAGARGGRRQLSAGTGALALSARALQAAGDYSVLMRMRLHTTARALRAAGDMLVLVKMQRDSSARALLAAGGDLVSAKMRMMSPL
jgi:hypothetical protein